MRYHQSQVDIRHDSCRPECHCQRYTCGRSHHCLWYRDQIADKMYHQRKVHSQNDSYTLENYHQVYRSAHSRHCSQNKHQSVSNIYHRASDRSRAGMSKCKNHNCCCNHDDSLRYGQGTRLCQHMNIHLRQLHILSGRGTVLGCLPIHSRIRNLLQCMDLLHQL